MAVHKFINPPESMGSLVVDGATIRICGPVALEAPKAASLLVNIPEAHQMSVVEELLEHGAAAAAAVQSSAHVVLLESKIEELSRKLNVELAEQLKTAGADATLVTEKLLLSHKEALTKLITPLTDPNVKDSLPTLMVELLTRAHKDAMNHIQVMLKDGEEGAIGKAVKQITEQVKELGTTLTKAYAEREALRTKSNRRGGCFEDVLSIRLPILARGMGRVEHCSREEGAKAGNSGDYTIVVESVPGGESVIIAVEAKNHAQRWSRDKIKAELKRARANRGAAASVFVGASCEMLPDGVGFGELSESDFWVVYDLEDGDETAITCALYMAKVAALATIVGDSGEQIDISALQREIGIIRGLLEQFSKIEACHSRIDKEVTASRTLGADLKSDILAALRRLDSLLAG